jgi:hypothetical protein
VDKAPDAPLKDLPDTTHVHSELIHRARPLTKYRASVCGRFGSANTLACKVYRSASSSALPFPIGSSCLEPNRRPSPVL